MFKIEKNNDNNKFYLRIFSTMWYLPENKIDGHLIDFFEKNKKFFTYNLECINETFKNYLIEIIFHNKELETLWILKN